MVYVAMRCDAMRCDAMRWCRGVCCTQLGLVLQVGDGTCVVRWLPSDLGEVPFDEASNLFAGLPDDVQVRP
jgi:hypothetical protein